MSLHLQLKQLPRVNWILFLSTFTNRLGSMAFVFLALYLSIHLKYSLRLTGALLSAYGVGALTSSLLTGWLSHRVGVWRLMLHCLLSNAVILGIFPLFNNPLVILVCILFWSITAETFMTANLVAVSQFCKTEQKKIAFALNRLGANLGLSIGPILGGILVKYHFQWVFFANFFSLIATAVIQIIFFRSSLLKKTHIPSGEKPAFISSFHTLFCNPSLICLLCLLFFVELILSQHEGTLPLFIVNYLNLPILTISLLFVVNTLLIIFLELPLNHWTNNWPLKNLLILSALFIAIGFGLYGYVTTLLGLMMATIIWTFGEMLLFPNLIAYISELTPAAQLGTYMAGFSLFLNFSRISSPLLGMQIFISLTPRGLWLTCFFLGMLVAACLFFLSHKKILRFTH